LRFLTRFGDEVSDAFKTYFQYPHRKKLMAIITIGIVLHLSLIAFDQAAYHGYIPVEYGRGPDIRAWTARGDTILKGDLLYRDVNTETPPVINLALTVPVALGGSLLAFQLFFTLCNLMVAIILYETIRKRDERLGALVAILYLVNPFTLFHATLYTQDEPLVLLFYLIPLVLLIRRMYHQSSMALGIGIWAKMWPLLLAPMYILDRRPVIDRAKAVALIGAVSAAILIPFLIVCPEDCIWFLKFYFLGAEGESAPGYSFWSFLELRGLRPPAAAMLVLVGVAVLGGYWYAYKHRWDHWRTATLVTCLFMVTYPKIHSGFYLLPLAMLLPYIVDDIKSYGLTFLMFGTVIGSMKFADGNIDPSGSLIVIPLLLTLTTDIILLFLLYTRVVTPGAEKYGAIGMTTGSPTD
jgi:hypothetical protein